MKVVNSTDYSDEDLRKIVYNCARHLRGGRKICKDLTIQFKTRHPSERATYSQNINAEDTPFDYPSGNAYLTKIHHSVGAFPGHRVYGYLVHTMVPKRLKSKRMLAFVITHELAHCLGEGHRRMRSKKRVYYDWATAESDFFSFVDSLPLRTHQQIREEIQQSKEPKVEQPKEEVKQPEKPKRNIRKERYEHALQMFKKYQSKVKRDQTLLKKWQKKVKYYEKK